jgi:hypothetical protein
LIEQAIVSLTVFKAGCFLKSIFASRVPFGCHLSFDRVEAKGNSYSLEKYFLP